MKSEQVAYSSVRGSLHQQKNIANQDAYLVKQYKFGTVLVLSDGLGSHRHSELGAHAACKAVSLAVQQWQNYDNKDIRLLIPLIYSIWNMEIFPYSREECGATCLFAFISNDEKLYIAQLGDGEIFLSIDNTVELIHAKQDEFSNFTASLNNNSGYKDWTIKEYDISNKQIKLFLMTDGVSETLIESSKIEFMELIWKKIGELESKNERNNLIFHILDNWNAVNAGDDRTIVCYKRK